MAALEYVVERGAFCVVFEEGLSCWASWVVERRDEEVGGVVGRCGGCCCCWWWWRGEGGEGG